MKHLIAFFLALLMICGIAQAHTRHHHRQHTVAGNISGISVRYVPGRYVCARNLGAWLRAKGFRTGNNFARSYFKFQHVARSQARPYDVVVYWRKGRASDGSKGAHVQLVLDFGAHHCKNPGSHGAREEACHAGAIVRTGRA